MRRALAIFKYVLASLTAMVMVGPLAWSLITGDFYLTVKGASMKPTYSIGDVVVAERPSGREATTLGTVVLVRFPGTKGHDALYAHRVVEVNGDRATLKGDNNDHVDPNTVTQADVEGTPRFVLAGKTALVFRATQNVFGRIALGVVFVGLLLIPLRAHRHDGRVDSDTDSDEGSDKDSEKDVAETSPTV